MNIRPLNRVTHAYVQRLIAPPAEVFPLLCPAREADVTCSHTSLGPQGTVFMASFTAEFYLQFMREWKDRMNHYLAHGTALRAGT
jgi:hypothetical protein